MGKMSREKGKRFERQTAALFQEAGYPEAHRTAQFRGNTGQAGDVEGVPLLHIECKHAEQMHLYAWMAQAVHDAEAENKDNLPVVIHKQNNKKVLVTMEWEHWIRMFRKYEAGGGD